MRRAARVDRNQPEIVRHLRSAGAVVVITSQLKNAFDILVGFRGRLFVMEIKDPHQPPSKRRLTSGEETCKRRIEASGNNYHIVETPNQALEIIGIKRFQS